MNKTVFTCRILPLMLAIISFMATPSTAIADDATLFQYPQIPENLETLTERSDFFIENFWKRANLKSAFSAREKFKKAFADYVTFMPYASADVVHKSINALIADVQKNADNLLVLGEVAENALYSDSAQVVCDECYLPFARAVANNRKISKAQKARFEYQAKALAGSQVGMQAPEFSFTTPDGAESSLALLPSGSYVLLFINDPDCDDCELARVRLAADPNLTDLIDRGLITVLSIYPGDPTDEWRESTKTYNRRWVVGSTPDIDEIYDMRRPPVIYYLNADHKILSKSFNIDNLLEAFRVVRNKIK